MFSCYAALLLRIVSNPVANFFQKKLSERESSLTVNFYSAFFMLLLSFFMYPYIDSSGFSLFFFFLVVLSGFLCFLSTICLIKALSIGEMSVLGPINSYKSVIGLAFAFLFLGEIPTLKSLTGFLVIVISAFLFVDESGKFILNKSVILRFLALLFSAVEAVILKKIILLSSPLTSFVLWVLSGFIFSFVFAFSKKKLKPKNIKAVPICALIAVLLAIMQFSTNIVFKQIDVGLSLALFQLSGVISLIMGAFFFKEKRIFRKTIGTLLMIMGSFLILIK